jgi:hypothetical protein
MTLPDLNIGFLAGPAQMAPDVSFLAQSGQMSFGM